MVQACQHDDQIASPPPVDCDMAYRASSVENTHLVLNRPHSVLLIAAIRGSYAKREAYTGALAAELRKADSKTDISDMHTRAAIEMWRHYGEQFVPEMRTTLMKKLILPGKTPPVVSVQQY